MAFLGYQFSFNGTSSFEHGLMIYDIDGNEQGDGTISSPLTIFEDKTPTSYKSIYHGASQNENLEFTLVFGADMCSIDKNISLDRYDIQAIGEWLTNVDGYKWLEIEQPDMENKRFHCIITDLKIITLGWTPWACSCIVHCDSPFAYTHPKTFTYHVAENSTTSDYLFSESSFKGWYYPDIKIKLSSGENRTVTITNKNRPDHPMAFTNIPNAVTEIYINGETCEITANDGIDVYDYFNFDFFCLKGGDTPISIQASVACDVSIICEFPINTGG